MIVGPHRLPSQPPSYVGSITGSAGARRIRLTESDAKCDMPAIRRCRRTRGLADADARLFALYLPGAELTLHATVHSGSEFERAMLAEALDKLGAAARPRLPRGLADQPAQRARHSLRHALRYLGRRLEGAARVRLIACTCRRRPRPSRSSPRPPRRAKPHPYMAYKAGA